MEAPHLEYCCELRIQVGKPIVIGDTQYGVRRIIPIVGGTFNGPKMKGEILSGGADNQIVRKDGVAELEAHHYLKTDDGVQIYFKNTGLRIATSEVSDRLGKGEMVSPEEYYFRGVPKFEAPIGRYYWLNNAVFICKGIKNPDVVLIQIWKVC